MSNRLEIERIRVAQELPGVTFRVTLRLGDVRLSDDLHIPEETEGDRGFLRGVLEDHLIRMFQGYARDLVRHVETESGGTFDNSSLEHMAAQMRPGAVVRFQRYNQPEAARNQTASGVSMQMAEAQLQINSAMRAQMGNTWGQSYERFLHGEFPDIYLNPSGKDTEKISMDLLAEKIGKEKYKQLKDKGYFEEQGKYGVVRFHKDTQGGVSLVERKKYGNTEREVVWSLCVQSRAADLPKGDVILSRWMEWKQDEDKFLDTANFRSINTRDEATEGRSGDNIFGRLGSFANRIAF